MEILDNIIEHILEFNPKLTSCEALCLFWDYMHGEVGEYNTPITLWLLCQKHNKGGKYTLYYEFQKMKRNNYPVSRIKDLPMIDPRKPETLIFDDFIDFFEVAQIADKSDIEYLKLRGL